MDPVKIVKEFYDQESLTEWGRIDGRPEFLLTCRYLDKYIKPGDKVLDIGGGPGRYSIYLAQKGCDVTLFDLSSGNIAFAKEKANEYRVKIDTVEGDARFVAGAFTEKFDHVLLMGPLYHLLTEPERTQAISSSLEILKNNGTFFATFISMMGGMIYAMKIDPAIIVESSEINFQDAFYNDRGFSGPAFTQAYFAHQNEILPFMEQFPLEKLHFFGQESISSPCEGNIMSQPKEIVDAWMDLCEKVCEKEELLSWSEHLMYVGRKQCNK